MAQDVSIQGMPLSADFSACPHLGQIIFQFQSLRPVTGISVLSALKPGFGWPAAFRTTHVSGQHNGGNAR
jgi:hypothetical protein